MVECVTKPNNPYGSLTCLRLLGLSDKKIVVAEGLGFPYGHMPDGMCLQAGPRGTRLALPPVGQTRASLRASNPTRKVHRHFAPLRSIRCAQLR